MRKKKPANQKHPNPVFSCRLTPRQQDLVFSYDQLATILGKKPSLARALEQMLIELGKESVGYGEERKTRKKRSASND